MTVVLAKAQSSPRPFTAVITPKTFLISLKPENKSPSRDVVVSYLNKALSLLRPCDDFIVLILRESAEPVGDFRHGTRFGQGSRVGYVSGDLQDQNLQGRPGWNDVFLDSLCSEVQAFIDRSQMPGRVRLEARSGRSTVGQDICRVAVDERAEVIVMKSNYAEDNHQKESVLECLQEAACAVAVIK